MNETDSEVTDAIEDAPLTVRQEAFVREYLIDLNATQAAIRAGFSANGANVTASQLLAKPNIRKQVDIAKAQRVSRVGMTADSVLHEMSILANSSLDWFYVDDEGQVKTTDAAPKGAMGAVQSIKKKTTIKVSRNKEAGEDDITKTYDVEIKLWDKPNPLKLMGKHVGIFPDKVEVTGKNGAPIAIENITRKIVKSDAE
jgi:phage terminase small subunit